MNCRKFLEAAERFATKREIQVREIELFVSALEKFERDMNETSAESEYCNYYRGSNFGNRDRSSSVREETKACALIERMREAAEADRAIAREFRESLIAPLEIFSTHESERQKAKRDVFAKTVEKVERERGRHARSNSSVSKVKFSEAASATDLARFELMLCLQRGALEAETIVDRVTVNALRCEIGYAEKMKGIYLSREVEDVANERETVLRQFEDEIEQTMTRLRSDVETYVTENFTNTFSTNNNTSDGADNNNNYDNVNTSRLNSPPNENENSQQERTLFDGSLTTDRARELSNKLTASLANLELLRSKSSQNNNLDENSLPSSSSYYNRHNRTRSEGVSLQDTSFNSDMLLNGGGDDNIEERILTQGYLWKRSRTLRDWKKRYFVLDVYGTLTYYRSSSNPKTFFHNKLVEKLGGHSGHNATHDVDLTEAHETVRLLTSTVKAGTGVDREDDAKNVKHFVANAFRIVSMEKTYVLRAESDAAAADWMEAITSAIAVLLNQNHHYHHDDNELNHYGNNNNNNNNNNNARTETMSNASSQTTNTTGHRRTLSGCSALSSELSDTQLENNPFLQFDRVQLSLANGHAPLNILRSAPGCTTCADCSMPEPEWASLNYGVVLCVECSGAHRGLGVHVSKVRSAILDVKVWTDPLLSGAFVKWGNSNANAVLEAKLEQQHSNNNNNKSIIIKKPNPKTSKEEKQDFITKKYAEKMFVNEKREPLTSMSHADAEILKIAAVSGDCAEIMKLFASGATIESPDVSREIFYACATQNFSNPCEVVEILVRNGFDLENPKSCCSKTGNTPLHCAVLSDNDQLAKFLVIEKRCNSLAKNQVTGLTALEAAMQRGYVRNAEMITLLSSSY